MREPPKEMVGLPHDVAHQHDIEDRETDVRDILGTLGFAMFYAWNFSGWLSPVLSLPASGDSTIELAYRLAALGTFTLFLFASRLFADAFVDPVPRRYLLAAAALLGSITPVVALLGALGLAISTPIALLSWIGFGAASGPLFLLWGAFSVTLGRPRAMPFTAMSYGLGALTYVLISHLEPTMGIVVTGVTMLLSIGLLMADSGKLVPFERIKISVSRARLDLWVPTAFRVAFEGAAFGLVLYYVVAGNDGSRASLIIGSATVVVAVLLGAFTGLGIRRVAPWGTIQRIALPVLLAGFLLMPYLSVAMRMVCMSVLVLAFACYDMSNWGLLAILGHEYKVQPVYHFSRGRSTILLGLTIGWGLGYLVNFSPAGSETWMVVVSLGVALALALVDAIVPFGADHLAMLEMNDAHVVPSQGSWRRRCIRAAEQYALSPRESEVFLLLAKGRNAAYIERTLVISGHTAKTHIYRIYKKLGIGTQQELIDLIENTPLTDSK